MEEQIKLAASRENCEKEDKWRGPCFISKNYYKAQKDC